MLGFAEAVKVVQLLDPAADAGGRATTLYCSLKNVHRAWIVAHLTQGAANTVLLAPKQATSVAGGGAKALTTVVPIWADEDCATTDALTRATDAVNFTTSAATKDKIVVFQIDPLGLDVSGGFDCVGLTTGASAAANITSAVLLAEMRYGSATPPSLVTD